MTAELEQTGAQTIVTACPLCKKAIVRNASVRVADISQVVAEHLRPAVPGRLVSERPAAGEQPAVG